MKKVILTILLLLTLAFSFYSSFNAPTLIGVLLESLISFTIIFSFIFFIFLLIYFFIDKKKRDIILSIVFLLVCIISVIIVGFNDSQKMCTLLGTIGPVHNTLTDKCYLQGWNVCSDPLAWYEKKGCPYNFTDSVFDYH